MVALGAVMRSEQRLIEPAIPARRSRLGKALVYRLLVLPATWSQFYRVWLKVEGPLPHPSDGPLIAYLNHPSWWDGYMAFLLDSMVLQQRLQSYIMMEERQLRSYRFFTWCGAFSVRPRDAEESARSIAYIARLLRERRDRILWIFPQGKLLPNDRRPLVVYPGAARIARMAGGALLWPVALRYEFRGEQRPEAFIRVGPAHYAAPERDEQEVTSEIGARLTAALDTLRDDVIHDHLDGYQVLLQGRPGVNRLFDAARGVLRLRRPRE